jgi:hypothetical protein
VSGAICPFAIRNEVFSHSGTLSELRQLLKFLDDRRRKPTYPLPGLPFQIHGTYSRDEVGAGLTELRGVAVKPSRIFGVR